MGFYFAFELNGYLIINEDLIHTLEFWRSTAKNFVNKEKF